MNPLVIDVLALIVFLSFALGYHAYYAMVVRHHRDWSARARLHEHRVHWVEMVSKRGERIMAVQTLRNLIMTNTFLASTMILLVAFVTQFIVSETGQRFLKPPHLQPDLLVGGMPVVVKAGLLLLTFAFGFSMFLTSLRNLNQLTILVSVEPDHIRTTENRDPVQFVARKLELVETQTTYGRRAAYFSLPVLGWYFSPWVFGIGTILIWLLFVYSADFVRPLPGPRAASESTEPKTNAPGPLPASK